MTLFECVESADAYENDHGGDCRADINDLAKSLVKDRENQHHGGEYPDHESTLSESRCSCQISLR